MTILSDYQFELLPSDDAVNGVVFGIGSGGVDMEDGGFLPGDDDWTTDDAEDQFSGVTQFGRDRLKGPIHGFNLFTNVTDENGALDAIATLRSAWRALAIRQDPGAVLPIRYRLNGRQRRFYGRPRRFAAPPSNLIQGGYVPITTDFQAADGFYYDDTEQTESITMRASVGESDTGMIFPVTFPVTSIPIGSGEGAFVVGGDAPAYPIIRINGPITNPRVQTDAWELSLGISLSADQYVEVDTRPWKKTVRLNGGASAANALSANPKQRLGDIRLQPGTTQVSLWGSSLSGSPTCTIRWRNTYNSY